MVILVSRFRRSQTLAASSHANFAIKRTLGPILAECPPPRHAAAIICPRSISFGGICSKMRGGFRVLSQQSESADDRPNTAGQNGAIVNQAARHSSAGERDGAETPAAGDKATRGEREHWLD